MYFFLAIELKLLNYINTFDISFTGGAAELAGIREGDLILKVSLIPMFTIYNNYKLTCTIYWNTLQLNVMP